MLAYTHTFIFIGRSGSGKGTQAQLLKEYLLEKDKERPVSYIEIGDRFRDFLKEGTYSSILSRSIAERGDLQPEFLSVWNWSVLFVQELTGNEHMILDGVPRRIREAHVLDSAMEFYDRKLPLVIYLDISKDTAEKRLIARKRADDVDKTQIQKRLSWFESEVLPVVELYKRDRHYNYIEVDGSLSVPEIHEHIIEQFETLYGYTH